jgi:hypothetical protein
VSVPGAVGDTPRLPLVGSEPVHAPLAEQVDALIEDQVTVADWPAAMPDGETLMLTLGGGVEEPPPQAASSKAAVKPTHASTGMQGGLRVASIRARTKCREITPPIHPETAVEARAKTIGVHFTVHPQLSGKQSATRATVLRDGCLAQCTVAEIVLTFF